MRCHVLLFGTLALSACGEAPGSGTPPPREAWATYDTVVTVGYATEDNPLLTWSRGNYLLADTSIMVHSSSREDGRMLVVNLLSGEGWEVSGDAGAEGPGEFGGRQPLVSESGDTIHTVAGDVYNGFSLDGEVLLTSRVSTPGRIRTPGSFLVGFLGAASVWVASGARNPGPDATRSSRARTIQVDDPIRETTRVLDIDVPDIVEERTEHDGYVSFAPVEGNNVAVAARGGTLAVATLDAGEPVRTYDAGGQLRAELTIDERLFSLRVDGDERVWVGVRSGPDGGTSGHIVFDRNLNELFRIAAPGVIDAREDMILSLRTERETGLQLMSLLRVRPDTR